MRWYSWSPPFHLAAEPLESSGCLRHELGDARQIPIRMCDVDVAQVGRQRGPGLIWPLVGGVDVQLHTTRAIPSRCLGSDANETEVSQKWPPDGFPLNWLNQLLADVESTSSSRFSVTGFLNRKKEVDII